MHFPSPTIIQQNLFIVQHLNKLLKVKDYKFGLISGQVLHKFIRIAHFQENYIFFHTDHHKNHYIFPMGGNTIRLSFFLVIKHLVLHGADC